MLAATRTRFTAGLSTAWKGLRLSLRSPEVGRTYLQLSAVLFLVATLLDASGIWAVWHFTATPDDASWWVVTGCWVARVLGIVVVLLAAPLLALSLVNAVFPFLGERVFLAAMRVLAPARAEQLAAMPGLPLITGAIIQVRRIVVVVALSLAIFVLSLVPLMGQVLGPVLQGYLAARGLAWELLDPYLDKLGMRYADQKALVAAHRPSLVGFGLPMGLLMAIPIVGPMLFGLAQGAAAQFVVDVIEAPPSQG